MSAWTDFVTKHFKEQKKKNASYRFRDALKDAAKLYKKGSSAMSSSTKKASNKSKKRRTARRRAH